MDQEQAMPPEAVLEPTVALARIVRHEVGDLLQSVYATAAILQERLPPDLTLERRVVADLRARAQSCKEMLDTVHDYVCPMALACEPVDLRDLVNGLVCSAASRFPRCDIRADLPPGPLAVVADPKRLAQLGNLLLGNACERSGKGVRVRLAPGPEPGEVEWTVGDDGATFSDSQAQTAFDPFPGNRYQQAGLNLALSRRIVELHGGRITAAGGPHGGLRMTVVLPRENPPVHEK